MPRRQDPPHRPRLPTQASWCWSRFFRSAWCCGRSSWRRAGLPSASRSPSGKLPPRRGRCRWASCPRITRSSRSRRTSRRPSTRWRPRPRLIRRTCSVEGLGRGRVPRRTDRPQLPRQGRDVVPPRAHARRQGSGRAARARQRAFRSRGVRQGGRLLSRYLAVKPEDPSVRTDLGTMYLYGGDADKAIAEYGKVLAKDEKFYQAHFNLGIAYAQKGDATKALASFARARDLAPDDAARQQIDAMADRTKAASTAARPREGDRRAFSSGPRRALRGHPIVGPKIVAFRWPSATVGEVRLREFPMQGMPEMVRQKFLDRLKGELADAKRQERAPRRSGESSTCRRSRAAGDGHGETSSEADAARDSPTICRSAKRWSSSSRVAMPAAGAAQGTDRLRQDALHRAHGSSVPRPARRRRAGL